MPRPPTLLLRALLRRCPNCGSRGIFTSWFHLRHNCPVCGIALEREEQGYVVGSYMFNIVVAELLFGAIFISVMLATWPSPPWRLLQYGSAVLMILSPVFFYPFSKTLFLAFDLIFRPVRTDDPRSHL